MAKTITPNLTVAKAICKDPVAFATTYIPLDDSVKQLTEQVNQAKADLKLAYETDPEINGKMVDGDRQVMVEPKTISGTFAPVTVDAVKDVLRGADLLEVTTTTVDCEKLNDLADRYEARGNKDKAQQIRNLLVRSASTTQLAVAIRKVGVTVTPISDASAPARKGVAVVA